MEGDSSSKRAKGAIGGVADYFAVVGVGDKLEYKCLSWSNAEETTTPLKTTTTASATAPTDSDEKLSTLLSERFRREIVQVAIVSSEGGPESAEERKAAAIPSVLTREEEDGAVCYSNSPGKESDTKDGYTVVWGTPSGVASEGQKQESGGGDGQFESLEGAAEGLDADLNPCTGLPQTLFAAFGMTTATSSEQSKGEGSGESTLDAATILGDLGRKVGSKFRNPLAFAGDNVAPCAPSVGSSSSPTTTSPLRPRLPRTPKSKPSTRSSMRFHVAYRQRGTTDTDTPAIADISLHYVRIHKSTVLPKPNAKDQTSDTNSDDHWSERTRVDRTASLRRGLAAGAGMAARLAANGRERFLMGKKPVGAEDTTAALSAPTDNTARTNPDSDLRSISLKRFLPLPKGYDDWVLPDVYATLLFSSDSAALSSAPPADYTQTPPPPSDRKSGGADENQQPRQQVDEEPTREPPRSDDAVLPRLLQDEEVAQLRGNAAEGMDTNMTTEFNHHDYIFAPVVAVRRQRIGEEERFHEDPAVVDITVSFLDKQGNPVLPAEQEEEEEEVGDEMNAETAKVLLSMTPWKRGGTVGLVVRGSKIETAGFGQPVCLIRHNSRLGFSDLPLSSGVLDRFPVQDYKGVPLPAEELPMFCYPTGCRLYRGPFRGVPVAQCYGFVVQNERGDSIYVSCVSFMEPLTRSKMEQLNQMSQRLKNWSLAHRVFCRRGHARGTAKAKEAATQLNELEGDVFASSFLTGFDDMTTFETKTICIIGRHPYWTAFRRFLSHLHVLSGSSSEVPIERYISHLLLSVPLPKPGGPNIIIPLEALSLPMILSVPPTKDLPLLDLPLQRLFACLEVSTVVMLVLGFLLLERKVIVLSGHPSLVLDVCELLRSLLFPFELCAPYVPRLVPPFASCLNFPGAIFVGIHDDGSEDGLAATVRASIPEDTLVVDLDTGEISCDGDRHEILKQTWGMIPKSQRSHLVSEIETLCRDVGLVPGQEPLESQVDNAFDVAIPGALLDDSGEGARLAREPFDDRAVRDCFLRFFCCVLGGYERFLVAPDIDFLVSGNEWFDTKAFLDSAPQERTAFLSSLVNTQLFQAFIQKRTEAGDLRCMLFDECMAEFHATQIPYGRLGGDVIPSNGDSTEKGVTFDLLVDQCAARTNLDQSEILESESPSFQSTLDSPLSHEMGLDSPEHRNKAFAKNVDASFSSAEYADASFSVNMAGDLICYPSREMLPRDSSMFLYCIDGNPYFPDVLNSHLFLPLEPRSLSSESVEVVAVPILTRDDREHVEAVRRRTMAESQRSTHNQRQCQWQLPKLMAAHFLGAWLMCLPSLISQGDLSLEKETKYLLRALGALRLLKGRQRLVPDEAAYRCLMVACGRVSSDRRVELVKLFGLLRSDGIFPSAVTLGQYTKGVAEGFAKKSVGAYDDLNVGVEVTVGGGATSSIIYLDRMVDSLDGNLALLEELGRRWRAGKSGGEAHNDTKQNLSVDSPQREVHSSAQRKGEDMWESRILRRSNRDWHPVSCSSSFAPLCGERKTSANEGKHSALKDVGNFVMVALWSRTASCKACGYVPLDEEIQDGWDFTDDNDENDNCIGCPRCGQTLAPMLGYRNVSVEDAQTFTIPSNRSSRGVDKPRYRDSARGNKSRRGSHREAQGLDGTDLPPQLRPPLQHTSQDEWGDGSAQHAGRGYVPYLNPSRLRLILEHLLEEHGEEILERDTLREIDPRAFYNLWWFCARFSLPLPLRIASPHSVQTQDENQPRVGSRTNGNAAVTHCCAFAAWDFSVAMEGCKSGAQAVATLLSNIGSPESRESDVPVEVKDPSSVNTDTYPPAPEFPLLGRFSLQPYSQSDWNHPGLSKVLFALVEACDKRDFQTVLESVVAWNKAVRRRAAASGDENSGLYLDAYGTVLYLARYHCTTAFHVFFPSTAKPCRGYHFWCATGAPQPIFDCFFRDAAKRLSGKEGFVDHHLADVSDRALGYRSVFGHLV